MNPLVHFRWYRRWRGGVWGHHSAMFLPWKTWTRFDYMLSDFSARLGDEDWRKTPNATEGVARQLAANIRSRPVHPWDFRHKALESSCDEEFEAEER